MAARARATAGFLVSISENRALGPPEARQRGQRSAGSRVLTYLRLVRPGQFMRADWAVDGVDCSVRTLRASKCGTKAGAHDQTVGVVIDWLAHPGTHVASHVEAHMNPLWPLDTGAQPQSVHSPADTTSVTFRGAAVLARPQARVETTFNATRSCRHRRAATDPTSACEPRLRRTYGPVGVTRRPGRRLGKDVPEPQVYRSLLRCGGPPASGSQNAPSL